MSDNGTSNGEGLNVNQLATMVGRMMIAAAHGKTHGGDRDLYTEFGYKAQPAFIDFFERYRRGGIAKRIITLPVQGAWRKAPVVYDDPSPERTTEFETALDDLDNRVKLWSRLARVDRMSRIGRFGVLMIGATANNELREPLDRSTELLHLTPYTEGRAEVVKYDVDPASERFNLPSLYRIHTGSAQTAGARRGQSSATTRASTIEVHHSRVIHIAEDMSEDEVHGTPALEAVLNYLDDLDKVVGGAGESFWRNAVPGLVAKLDADAKVEDGDKKALGKEIDEFIHKLRRVIRIQGGDVTSLAGATSDPASPATTILQLIAGTTGIPLRILIGSERGELASTQDVAAFANLVQDRQENHVEPNILRPTIDRLIELGILPKPKDGTYEVEWPDAHTPSEAERAETSLKKAQAMRNAFGPLTETMMGGSVAAQFMEGLGFDVSEVDFDEDDIEPIGEDPTQEGDPDA